MTENERLLVSLCAQADACFWPMRGEPFNQRLAQVMLARQELWLSGGFPISQSIAPHGRRRDTLLADLRADGLLSLTGTGRAAKAKPTLKGELIARGKAGLDDIIAQWDLLLWLDRLVTERKWRHGMGMVCEPVLACLALFDGAASQQKILTCTCLKMMPFLTGGLAQCSVDGEGRCWYGVTRRGKRAIAAGRPEDPIGDVALNERAVKWYDKAFADAQDDLFRSRPPVQPGIVIPVSCGTDWGASL